MEKRTSAKGEKGPAGEGEKKAAWRRKGCCAVSEQERFGGENNAGWGEQWCGGCLGEDEEEQ
ncbi:hypothetical protein DEO72_LG11g456 [Vigna unguiculata]|uniref:Uncharacterized protein n=1 Tax=Vigna unguiculata TaxID=3917 RepID=A0A4D6NHX9_VIGUN|nr:hypothetical protein DEO72_LG11g456 [Vigna unguiculata]